MFEASTRAVDNSKFNIKSVPMGAGGTVPYDEGLEEAKAALAHRTAPLYNKGGPQYVSDDLVKDIRAGNTRRRN